MRPDRDKSLSDYGEGLRLNLLVAFVILLAIIGLIMVKVVSDWAGLPLLYAVGAVAFTSLLIRKKEPARLAEFFVKSFSHTSWPFDVW